MVRITVQGMKEADSCELIKNGLVQRGYDVPLIADIHFYPPAAMRVLDFVDKVRINPGNFLDKRAQFKVITYDDITYLAEIAKIEEGFSPLIEKCKKQKKALRIGTNHGSLSDRIMNRWDMEVHFCEDVSVAATGNPAETLAALKRLASTIIRIDLGGVLGTAQRRCQAAWDGSWTLKLLATIFDMNV